MEEYIEDLHWNSAIFRVQVEFPNVLLPSLIFQCQTEVMQQPKPYQLCQILLLRHGKVCIYDGLPELITHGII